MPDEPGTAPLAPLLPRNADVASRSVTPRDPSNYFWLSVVIPGAGQIAQRLYVSAAIQTATVCFYMIAASAGGGGRALFLALVWNLCSAVDAYRQAQTD